MDTDLRSSLVAAAAAALLSALIGAIAGVGFGMIALRALLCGALFGGFAYGGLLLARRILPGLEASGPGLVADGLGQLAEEEDRGRAVNIVLPSEGPNEDVTGEAPSLQELSSFAPANEFAVPRAAERAPSERSQAEPVSAATLISADDPGAEELGSLLGPDEADAGTIAVPPAEGRGGAAFEDLDVLPDLDGFSDSFAPAGIHAAEASSSSPRGGSSGSSSIGGGSGSGRTENLDPAALAQAVRTILKRDQKG